jgi:hypothetical protein
MDTHKPKPWRGLREFLREWLLARPSDEVIAAVEQHFASMGTIVLVRPVLISFGGLSPGARQYNVDLLTALGLPQSYRVAVEASGRVQTLM